MNTALLNDFVAVPLPADLYQDITDRYAGRVSSLIENVVRDFLDRTESGTEHTRKSRTNGVRWNNIFLPHKTSLRTKYQNEYKYAEIKDDKIIFEGKEIASISRLARRMRGNTSVNAWLHIEVMRPGDREWHLANVLRRG